MSCVAVFIGQCGVSLGLEILKSEPPFLQCYDGSQHAVFIDTEIKVLRRINSSLISSNNVFSDLPGCGGCFAKGSSSAQTYLPQILDKIHSQIERTDCCMGILLVHSLCGGTGSGYGSSITQELKSTYPEMFVVNVGVLPFKTGENPIQAYNVVLALAGLQESSDMVILVENSAVSADLSSLKSNISISQINFKIVQDLQLIFRNAKQIPNRCALWEVLKVISSIPTIKLASLGSSYGLDVTANCNQAVRSIRCRTGFSKFHSVSGIVMSSDNKYCLLDKKIEEKFQKAFNFVEWNPFPVEFWCSKSKDRGVNYAVNNEQIASTLVEISDAAMLKCHAGAYLHWFEQYGVYKEDFEHAFNVVSKIQEDYVYYCR